MGRARMRAKCPPSARRTARFRRHTPIFYTQSPPPMPDGVIIVKEEIKEEASPLPETPSSAHMTEVRSMKRKLGMAEETVHVKSERLQEAERRRGEAEELYEEEHTSFTKFSKLNEDKWEQRFDTLAAMARAAGVQSEEIEAVRKQPWQPPAPAAAPISSPVAAVPISAAAPVSPAAAVPISAPAPEAAPTASEAISTAAYVNSGNETLAWREAHDDDPPWVRRSGLGEQWTPPKPPKWQKSGKFGPQNQKVMKQLKELYGSEHAAFEAGWRWAAEPLQNASKHLHHYYPPGNLDAFRSTLTDSGIRCGPQGILHGDTMIILDELRKTGSCSRSV